MSILSTNNKLIKVGQDYSAGSGISIDDHVISVTGEFGKTYSAGDNISIYEQGEQLYISSKDWTNDIANASSNAYNEAVAQIPDPFDPTFISGQVDNKLDTTAFTNWQNGQYSTDLQTIEGQINNKLDESAFSQVSASFLTAAPSDMATTGDVAELAQTISETYQVKGDYATVEYVDSATSGLSSHTVEYYKKPSANAIEAYNNTLYNVGRLFNEDMDFYIVPSSILQVPKVITVTSGKIITPLISATKSDGFCFSGDNNIFSANRYGLINSASYSYFSAGAYNYIHKPSLVVSSFGCKIDINISGGSAVDYDGKKKWQIGEADHLWSFADGGAYTAQPIVLCNAPQSNSSMAPYFKAGPGGISSELNQNNNPIGLYGDFANGIRHINTPAKTTATLNYWDVKYTKYNTTISANEIWSLTGSVQKREIEYDADTSAITAIAGSAIGGGGGVVPQSAFDELKTSYDALSSLFATYSGKWLLPNEGV